MRRTDGQSQVMGHYRNHPGGMGGMSENVNSDMKPVYLDDLATGNRAMRRFAKRKMAAMARSSAKKSNHGGRNGAPP